jgi:hypothetical protein
MMNIIKSADTGFHTFSLLQDRVFYRKNENLSEDCHYSEIKRSIQHQSEDHHIEKQAHLMEIYAEMEQHFQQLNADLLSSTKENGIYLQIYLKSIFNLLTYLSTLLTVFHLIPLHRT